MRRRIPELLRLWDRDPVHVDLVEVLDLPNNLRQAISVATKQRLELEQRSQAVQRDMERTIRRLQSQLKLGVRDSGELLGISPQYAHKLRHRTDVSRSAKVRKAASTRLPRYTLCVAVHVVIQSILVAETGLKSPEAASK